MASLKKLRCPTCDRTLLWLKRDDEMLLEVHCPGCRERIRVAGREVTVVPRNDDALTQMARYS